MDEKRLASIADTQHGLFTRAQARGCGYSTKQIRHRVASARWQCLFGSVFTLAGATITAQIRDLALQLAVPGGVLAGASAARWWGIAVPDRSSCLSVGPASHPRLTGARFLRDAMSDEDVVMIEGVLVTSRARTVFDCLRLLAERDAIELLDRALQQRWITVADLSRRVTRFVGRHGAPKLARLVRVAASGTRSHAERVARRLLRRAGIDGWTSNFQVFDDAGLIGTGDLVFRAEKLVIEVDGWAFHTTPDRFQRDRTRQNRLIAAGWTVLRFTWRDLVERPEYVIEVVQATRCRLRSRKG